MATNWVAVGAGRLADCPSPTFREWAVRILTVVDQLGPLGIPVDEYRRVYRFLHYNDPARLLALAQGLLDATSRRAGPIWVHKNAWNFLVGVYDHWILRARVFYVVCGILEDTLRACLNGRMTDVFGPDWPRQDAAVPNVVRSQLRAALPLERAKILLRILDEMRGRPAIEIVAALEDATGDFPTGSDDGPTFVRALEFGQLRVFFQARRLWGAGPLLETLFAPVDGRRPLRSEVDTVLGTLHELRNDVAHYTATKPFAPGLFATAKLARWLGVDLQHVYGSIDTRASTELSLLLEDHTPKKLDAATCAGTVCTLALTDETLLDTAPCEPAAVPPSTTARWACLHHRVKLRVRQHRPWALP